MSFFGIDPSAPENDRILQAQEISRTLARFQAKVYHRRTLDWPPGPLGTPCHCWSGAVQKTTSKPRKAGGPRLPYGRFKFQGRVIPAHVFAFAAYHKRDPATLGLIAHECDNPLCVRPDHLKETVPTVNNRETYARGRKRVTVPQRALQPAYCDNTYLNWTPADRPYVDLASPDGQIWGRIPASSVDAECPIHPKLRTVRFRPVPLEAPVCTR